MNVFKGPNKQSTKTKQLTDHHVDKVWLQPSQELSAEADPLKINIHSAVYFKFLTRYHL